MLSWYRGLHEWTTGEEAGVLDELTLEGGMWIFVVTALLVISGLIWAALSGFVGSLITALQGPS